MPSDKKRWFIVTNWNCDINIINELIDTKKIRYVGYYPEICPNTKKQHFQMYVYMYNNLSSSVKNLNKIGDWFGKVHCYVEVMHGKIWENEGYCSKENNGELLKLGIEPKQGLRGDLDETKDLILSGELNAEEIAIQNPMFYHQYGRTMEKLTSIALRKQWRQWMTLGEWVYGESGSGKSHYAFTNYHPNTHYVKNLNEDWWDGYTGQEIVIFNEFRCQITLSELLDLVDKWPKTVKWRNRESVPFLAKKVMLSGS